VLSPLRLFATFCVLAPTVAVIAVPTYDSATPKLGGFPFFYWYQLLWVVLTGILMVAAYFAIRTDERQRKSFRTASGPPLPVPAPTASPEAAPDGAERGGPADPNNRHNPDDPNGEAGA
jgi:hypothetical protein